MRPFLHMNPPFFAHGPFACGPLICTRPFLPAAVFARGLFAHGPFCTRPFLLHAARSLAALFYAHGPFCTRPVRLRPFLHTALFARGPFAGHAPSPARALRGAAGTVRGDSFSVPRRKLSSQPSSGVEERWGLVTAWVACPHVQSPREMS